MESFKYPIGRYKPEEKILASHITGWIDDIKKFPSNLVKEISTFSDSQLDTPYRKNGWSIRQLVHHVADSHTNAFIRFKLALTEDRPTIKPYFQDLWAELGDSTLAVAPSLQIIEGIHHRWSYLLKNLKSDDFERELIHPESGKVILKSMIGHYAWHGKHHLAHITTLKKRNNWY